MNVYSIVTEKIMQSLKQGVIPWRKPWDAKDAMPVNHVTGKAYRGINVWLLSGLPYASNRWLSFNQCRTLGGDLSGQRSPALIVFYKLLEKKDKDSGKIRKIPFLQYTPVFNVSQCKGIELPSEEKPFNAIGKAVEIAMGMPNKPLLEHGGGQAYYSPACDKVVVPATTSFNSESEYYSTLFHELSHATGHSSRLNRPGIQEVRFGSEKYSFEELIAELSSAFLCQYAGIHNTLDNSASYIQGWLSKLSDDDTLIVKASSQAQKATDYILGKLESKAELE